jgi:hypothetical protein
VQVPVIGALEREFFGHATALHNSCGFFQRGLQVVCG